MRKHLFILSWMVMSSSIASSQSKYIQAVDEYVPAPGQFVNTMPEATIDDTPATMAQKCTAAIANGNGELITLGAWGGYVTFHFDHPVVNVEGVRDFAIWGNAFQNNAEPAIVLVSVDGNYYTSNISFLNNIIYRILHNIFILRIKCRSCFIKY